MSQMIYRGLAVGMGALTAVAMTAAPALAGKRDSNTSNAGGALSGVTSGVRAATSPPPRAGGGAPSSSSSSSSSNSRTAIYYYDPDPDVVVVPHCYGCGSVVSHGPPPRPGTHPNFALDIGLQSVDDSDGAAMGALRVTGSRFGLGIAGTRYFESVETTTGSDTIYMNVWSFTAVAELARTATTHVFVHAGLGGTNSNEFEEMLGPTVGLELEHGLSPGLDVRGGARYFLWDEDVQATEARLGIGASFISVGYRVLRVKTTDGALPALHGPEVGISLRY